jgi:hypothetical protein
MRLLEVVGSVLGEVRVGNLSEAFEKHVVMRTPEGAQSTNVQAHAGQVAEVILDPDIAK